MYKCQGSRSGTSPETSDTRRWAIKGGQLFIASSVREHVRNGEGALETPRSRAHSPRPRGITVTRPVIVREILDDARRSASRNDRPSVAKTLTANNGVDSPAAASM